MKLDEKLVQLLHGSVALHLGTRDEALMPHANRVLGTIVSPDREFVTIYIRENQSAKPLKNLIHNGKAALSVSDILTLESIQIKGTYVSSREGNPEDESIQDIYLSKFRTTVKKYFGVTDQLDNFLIKPARAITFKIDEVYNQTPGPGSGNKYTEGNQANKEAV